MAHKCIYHILPAAEFDRAKALGRYSGDTLGTEGFIHFSDIHQVLRVANTRFLGRENLSLIEVDLDKLEAPLKYEDGGHGDGELFPHLYGELNLDAVVRELEFKPVEDGTFELPDGLGG